MNTTQTLSPLSELGVNSKRALSAWAGGRRIAGFIMLLLGAAISTSHAQRAHTVHPESLRFVQPYLWLGYVDHDQSVSFVFELKNDTDKAVKIVSAEASCRCTSLEGNAPDEIPRHGTGSFKWVFNSTRSGGGFESKEIIITTADGKELIGKFEAWVGKGDESATKPGVRSQYR